KPGPNEARERLDKYADAGQAEPEYLAGVYSFGDRVRAVNRPPSEDLDGQIDANSLETVFEGTTFSLFEDSSGSARENISRGVWRGFLMAMLFFLLAEALLCIPKPPIESTTPMAGAQPAHPR